MTTEAPVKPSELSGHKDQGAGYDADASAQAREREPITIGGKTFTRRRKNWDVTRSLRALLRAQERAGTKTDRLSKRLAELDGSELDRLQARLDALAPDERDSDRAKRWRARVDELEAQAAAVSDDDRDEQIADLQDQLDAAQDTADQAAYELIALLLRDGEGASPPVGFLKVELDVEDAGDLAAKLAGGGEPDPQPAPTETSTS